jgi:hypothetical protein
MKKILLLFLLFMGHIAFGQNGWYLQPSAGIGMSNVTQSGTPNNNFRYVSAFDAELGIGYRHGDLLFSSGISYMRTGAKTTVTILDVLGNPVGTMDYRFYFYHLVVPFTFGYQISLGRKLAFTPSAGFGLAYNTGEKETDPALLAMGSNEMVSMPSAEFDNYYKRISVLEILQANIDYKASSSLDITCGPAANYMLTNIFNSHNGAPNNPGQRNYAFLFNAGIRWHLSQQKAAGQPEKKSTAQQ